MRHRGKSRRLGDTSPAARCRTPWQHGRMRHRGKSWRWLWSRSSSTSAPITPTLAGSRASRLLRASRLTTCPVRVTSDQLSCPSHQLSCPSHQLPCPSHQLSCLSIQLPCPSHHLSYPSHHSSCPSHELSCPYLLTVARRRRLNGCLCADPSSYICMCLRASRYGRRPRPAGGVTRTARGPAGGRQGSARSRGPAGGADASADGV